MDEKTLQDRITIGAVVLELILKYGLPLALKMVETLMKENANPSLADWVLLRDRVPHPSHYEEEA